MTAIVAPALTLQQQRILEVTRGYFVEHGRPPAAPEIAILAGLSEQECWERINQLAWAGWIRKVPGRWALEVLNPADGTES